MAPTPPSPLHSRRKFLSDPFPRIFLIPIFAGIVLLLISARIDVWMRRSLMEERRSQAEVTVGRYASNLSVAINERFALLNGLKAYAESHLEELDGSPSPDLEIYMMGLLEGHTSIRNFLVAPRGINLYEFPQQSNEGLLGINMLADTRPAVRADIHRALETHAVTISGPYELRQGGLGLVARQALFHDGEFWGLIAMALDVPPILQEAGLAEGDGEYRLALRDASGNVFFGDPTVFVSDPVIHIIHLPEWSWELAAIPSAGWDASVAAFQTTYRLLALALCGLLLAVIYLLGAQRQRLIEQVSEKTRELSQATAALHLELEERRRADAALRASQHRYQLLFETGSDAMLVYPIDPNGRPGCFTEVNNTACQRLGYTRDELLQLSALDVIDPALLPKFGDFLASLAAEGSAMVDSFHRTKTGQLLPVEVSSQLFWIEETPMVFSIARDIAARKKMEAELRESEARFRLLAENAHDLIYRYRFIPEPGFEYVSQAALAITGYTPEEHYADPQLGMKIVHPDDQYKLTAYQEQGASSEAPVILRWVKKDGTLNWTEQHNRLIYDDDGNLVALEGIARDITERKQAEAEILRLNAGLEQRVAERTAELSAANQEMEAFAYSVAHDLRTPLRSIAGFSEILLEDGSARLDDSGRRYLGRIYDASQKMGQIIDDLLRLLQVRRDDLHLETIDITGKVNALVCDLREREPGRVVDVTVEPGLEAQADRRLIGMALEQLLENAWKFTREIPDAHIEVGCLDRAGEEIRPAGEKARRTFYICDNGAGFDMAFSEKLFQPFQRLHALAQYSGEGVGLAVVERIIQRHGGRIWAEGEVGKGARFYFTLDMV